MKTLIIFALVCTTLALRHRNLQTKETLCGFCMSFIGGIEGFLKKEEGPIEQYGERLCDELTAGNSFLDPICKQLIATELPKIVDWLENNEKPADVCAKLHLC